MNSELAKNDAAAVIDVDPRRQVRRLASPHIAQVMAGLADIATNRAYRNKDRIDAAKLLLECYVGEKTPAQEITSSGARVVFIDPKDTRDDKEIVAELRSINAQAAK